MIIEEDKKEQNSKETEYQTANCKNIQKNKINADTLTRRAITNLRNVFSKLSS